jgi:hypothetical protein
MPKKKEKVLGETEAPKSAGSQLEYWLKLFLLITSAGSATLALLPQASSLFGSLDYGAEILLSVAVVGVMTYLIFAFRKERFKTGKAGLNSKHVILIGLVILTPVLGFILWRQVLRVPPDKEEIIKREIALGDNAIKILKDPEEARDHYRNALLLAPRRGSIRAKVQDAEERMRLKGNKND